VIIVSETTNTGIVLRRPITAHNIPSFLLDPHQKPGIILSIFVRQGKSGQRDLGLRNWSQTNFLMFETNIGSQRPNTTRQKFLHSVPTSDIPGVPDESIIT
jgi:hypothetical protein